MEVARVRERGKIRDIKKARRTQSKHQRHRNHKDNEWRRASKSKRSKKSVAFETDTHVVYDFALFDNLIYCLLPCFVSLPILLLLSFLASHRGGHDAGEDIEGPHALDDVQRLRVRCQQGPEEAHRVYVHLCGCVCVCVRRRICMYVCKMM